MESMDLMELEGGRWLVQSTEQTRGKRGDGKLPQSGVRSTVNQGKFVVNSGNSLLSERACIVVVEFALGANRHRGGEVCSGSESAS